MPTADIKAIAEGLSEAQRRWFAKNPYALDRPQRIWLAQHGFLTVNRRYGPDPSRREWTPLGLGLREYLEKHNDG